MNASRPNKLYAYIDETGQDTQGAIFIVTVVLVAGNRDAMRRRLGAIERSSNKKARKWSKTRPQHRIAYIQQILNTDELIGTIYFSQYRDSKAYVDLTILSTAKAILDHTAEPSQATIFVDGLGRAERHRFAAGLRKLRVQVDKVRGTRDDSEEYIRLADAIAGFVRAGLHGSGEMAELFRQALTREIVREV